MRKKGQDFAQGPQSAQLPAKSLETMGEGEGPASQPPLRLQKKSCLATLSFH